MNNKIFLIKTLIIYLLLGSISFSANYYEEGKKLFQKKEFDKSKFLFEKDIVFNPKNERSYLFLAKIFKEKENEEGEELNLNSVLVLNPKNEEAIYMLTLLKIKQFNYNEAKDLIEKFDLVCSSLCSKKSEINKKFNKLKPEDEKNNN